MISEGVIATRKAVANVIAFVAFWIDRAGRFVARAAGCVYPAPAFVAVPVRPNAGALSETVYTVLRWQKGRHWTAYSGRDGALARRCYENVKQARETGRMEFQMTVPTGYVVRGVYENGEW